MTNQFGNNTNTTANNDAPIDTNIQSSLYLKTSGGIANGNNSNNGNSNGSNTSNNNNRNNNRSEARNKRKNNNVAGAGANQNNNRNNNNSSTQDGNRINNKQLLDTNKFSYDVMCKVCLEIFLVLNMWMDNW